MVYNSPMSPGTTAFRVVIGELDVEAHVTYRNRMAWIHAI
jgi:hypothetical protein